MMPDASPDVARIESKSVRRTPLWTSAVTTVTTRLGPWVYPVFTNAEVWPKRMNSEPKQSLEVDSKSVQLPRLKILNWPNASEAIEDDTPLICYMKLSTFLLLLDNRLFIPTLKLLQAGDRLESLIPEKLCENYFQKMKSVVGLHARWLIRSTIPRVALNKDDHGELDADSLRYLTERWLSELAKRRCIWCWNRSTEQLHAMWKIYGERGVAIFSTVGRIREALAIAGAYGIVSPVRYVARTGPPRPEDNRTMSELENLRRPYLFKDGDYRIEEEVRFVLRTNPRATSDGGAMTNITAKKIISHFEVSPDIPSEEVTSIKELERERLNTRVKPAFEQKMPNYPFLEPFGREPDIPCVFPDLD
jgi:hypothetical protein